MLGCVVPLAVDQDGFFRAGIAPGVGDGGLLRLIVVDAVDAVAF